jgi:hypothetical protein
MLTLDSSFWRNRRIRVTGQAGWADPYSKLQGLRRAGHQILPPLVLRRRVSNFHRACRNCHRWRPWPCAIRTPCGVRGRLRWVSRLSSTLRPAHAVATRLTVAMRILLCRDLGAFRPRRAGARSWAPSRSRACLQCSAWSPTTLSPCGCTMPVGASLLDILWPRTDDGSAQSSL